MEMPQTTLDGYISAVTIYLQNQKFKKLVRSPSQWSKTWQNEETGLLMKDSYLCWLFHIGKSTETCLSPNDQKWNQFENDKWKFGNKKFSTTKIKYWERPWSKIIY